MDKIFKTDSKLLDILNLIRLNKSKQSIYDNKDKLWLFTNHYLESNGAKKDFLNKPAVVERVKKILFENLLLGDKTKIYETGQIIEIGNNYNQSFGITEDGNIFFYRKYEDKKRITLFDIIDEEIVCRFFEFDNTGYIRTEKRVTIDEYGFDYKYEDLSGAFSEKSRDFFQNIISSVNDQGIIALADYGSYSITDLEDKYFLGRDFENEIEDEMFLPNYIAYTGFRDVDDIVKSYPTEIKSDFTNIKRIKHNFDYYTNRYSESKQWFIDRFGKNFLINNGFISKECEIVEKSQIEKIELASDFEVYNYFLNRKLDYYTLSCYAKRMYSDGQINKFYTFINKMSDEQKIRFVIDNDDLYDECIVEVISQINLDNVKQGIYEKIEDDLDIEEKVLIVESFKDEKIKVSYYENYIDQIIQHDIFVLENLDDVENKSGDNILSEKVLDSLSEHDNLYYFLIKLKHCSTIKYKYIKDFNRSEIDEVIEGIEENLSPEEYGALFSTTEFDDDFIIKLLEENWEDGFNLSRNDPEFEIGLGIERSLKVIGLQSVKDIDKKIKFLEEHIDDFGADQITIVLKSIGDSDLMLSLAKKYGLSKYYYYELVVLCDDDKIFDCIESEEDMDEDDFVTLITTIYDMPRAFKYIEQNNEFSVMDKLRILSYIETDLAEDPEIMKKMKKDFLKENKEAIIKGIKQKSDLDDFMSFIRDFEFLTEQDDYIESFKNSIPDFDDDSDTGR